jgi:DNA primase
MGYPNAVAVMGSHLSVEQVEKLVALLSDVTIVPDGDEPGGVAAAKWERALTGRVPVRTVTVRDGADPDQYDQDELDELLALTG